MDLSKISRGENPPVDINVVIEVPANSAVKYEMDKESGAVFVDRILFTPMFYPCNYGFMPNTLSDDGDPVDVLVVGRHELAPGSVIRAVPVGVLMMEDEKGGDEKIVAVPEVLGSFRHVLDDAFGGENDDEKDLDHSERGDKGFIRIDTIFFSFL